MEAWLGDELESDRRLGRHLGRRPLRAFDQDDGGDGDDSGASGKSEPDGRDGSEAAPQRVDAGHWRELEEKEVEVRHLRDQLSELRGLLQERDESSGGTMKRGPEADPRFVELRERVHRLKDGLNQRHAERNQLRRQLDRMRKRVDALTAQPEEPPVPPELEVSAAQTEPREALKRFSDSPCTAWARRGTSACTNAGGPMQAYSMDLRERALLDSDAGMKAADVAVKYRVSGSWVRLLKQRRRETGEVAPRVQRHGRRRMLEPHLHTLAALIAEQPDRTVAELKDALGTPASLATIWRAVAALDVTVKKNGPALRTRST